MIKDHVTSLERLSHFSLGLTEKEKQELREKIRRRITWDAIFMTISTLSFVGYLIIYFSNFWG